MEANGVVDRGEVDGEPDLVWLDFEDAYAKAYEKGPHADQFLEIQGDTEALRLYLRYRSYNLMLGRPLFPDKTGGVRFFAQVVAPPDRPDIRRELYAALDEDDRLFFLSGDVLENAGRPRTEEILKMIRQAHIIPKTEFLEETG